MTGEADRRWSKLQAGSNGDRRRLGRFRPRRSWLGVGEGGGGAGEDARAKNRGMVAGGGRSKAGDDSGASGRAELVSGRWDEEKGGYDNRGPQLDKYLGVIWADCPEAGCYIGQQNYKCLQPKQLPPVIWI